MPAENLKLSAGNLYVIEYYSNGLEGYGRLAWYLTEHRLPAHAIWSYKIDTDGNITDVNTVY